jgi:hypothetical protein
MTNQTADALVAEARRAVHELLVVLPAREADEVRARIADLETAVESRTAIRYADAAGQTPADQAAGWLDAAAECNKAGGVYAERGANDAAGAAFALMETFLRRAGQAEYAATPCSVVPCEDGGEPCDVHERLMGHAEGDHELCAPDCGEPWLRRLADEAQPAQPQTGEAVAIPPKAATKAGDEAPHIYMTAVHHQAGWAHDFLKAGRVVEALEHVGAIERLAAVTRRAVAGEAAEGGE